MNYEFSGYERNNGVGVRNHILIVPTVTCSEYLAKRITDEALRFYNNNDGRIKFLHNPYGCGQAGKDLDQTTRTLINTAANPNVAAVLVLSLGCESIDAENVADKISETKRVEFLRIQNYGMKETLVRSLDKLKELALESAAFRRKSFSIDSLSVALKCGGSDYTSGLVSNPIVGRISDEIVKNGGTTIIGEIPEFIGAEQIYAARAKNEKIKIEILRTVKNFEEKLKSEGQVDFRNAQPSPGNIEGGLTTIEEKSLGAVKKSGNAIVEDVLDYSMIPEEKGHFLMNTPGYDVEAVTGEVAGGCTIVLFTTGRGTPTGNPVAPVLKITANAETASIMDDLIDFDCSGVLNGEETFEEATKKLMDLILKTADGKLTKSEINCQDDFLIYRIGPTY